MKIQTPTEFLTFNDGLCNIYSLKGNAIDQKLMTLCFGNRTIGVKRNYAARAASTKIDRLIQVPLQMSITASNRVVIDDAEYKIDFVQYLKDTNPPVDVLTLVRTG